MPLIQNVEDLDLFEEKSVMNTNMKLKDSQILWKNLQVFSVEEI